VALSQPENSIAIEPEASKARKLSMGDLQDPIQADDTGKMIWSRSQAVVKSFMRQEWA
jgi:hypothetical protein